MSFSCQTVSILNSPENVTSAFGVLACKGLWVLPVLPFLRCRGQGPGVGMALLSHL